MVKKILLLLLIASIHSEKTPLKVTQIDDYKEHKISNQNNSLVCVELNKDLKKDQKFYIVVFTKQKGETIDKDIHYNITETSCKNDTFDIDLTNLKKEFEKMVEIKNEICKKYSLDKDKFIASFGTSQDFNEAILSGTDEVRIGHQIFEVD